MATTTVRSCTELWAMDLRLGAGLRLHMTTQCTNEAHACGAHRDMPGPGAKPVSRSVPEPEANFRGVLKYKP